MKLALAGLFMLLGAMTGIAGSQRHDIYFIMASMGFSAASIICSVSILRGYKGEKRQ